MPRIVDTVAAQLATGVAPALMRHWLRRGKLTRHGHDYDGRALVDLDEVIAARDALAAYTAANPAWNRAACGSRTGVSH